MKVEQGQLLCNSYTNTTVLSRFNNSAATPYGCTGADDYCSYIVFIRDGSVGGMENRMKTAKTIYFAVNVYQ